MPPNSPNSIHTEPGRREGPGRFCENHIVETAFKGIYSGREEWILRGSRSRIDF